MTDADLAHRLANLSPAKRAVLELRLKQKRDQVSSEHTIPRRAARDFAPLSFAQQRLWFLNQLEPASPNYNEPKAVRLTGALNIAALRTALNRVVERHEVLRTTIATVDGIPRQLVNQDRGVELAVIDLLATAGTAREAEANRILVETIRRPFDLSRDLVLRCLLLRLGEREHILLLVTHHIASDGWSSGILWREIAELYRACIFEQPCELPQLPIQYRDYAEWQRDWLQGEVLDKQLSYWRQHLAGISILELPADRPRPTVQSGHGARLSFTLAKDLTEALEALSRKQGVTLYMLLLAAFQTLLHRYTGQEDIAVGSPIAGRTRHETEDLIGFFVNTLVLRTNLSGNPRFLELLERVRQTALGAYDHQEVPFEKIVEELKPERDLSRNPFFQVMFAYQNVPRRAIQIPGLTVSPVELDIGTAKFELSLSLYSQANGLHAVIQYNTDLFDSPTIRRMARHYERVLKGVVANPAQRIGALPILTDAEYHQLLFGWNDTQNDYPRGQCLHVLFEAQVKKSPDAIAVVFPATGSRQREMHLTYRQLNASANRLARHLRNLGVGPEALVGICMERCVEMVVGLLAILKAGGAYVPLDPTYPKERLAFMLQDARVSALLTGQKWLSEFPHYQGRIICLDRDLQQFSQQSDENLKNEASADTLAYVIYTSGSTGQPKGVMIPHKAICNHMVWMQGTFPLDKTDRVLQKTPFSFDAAVWEFFAPLLAGARLVLAAPDGHRDGAYLVKLMREENVTVLQVVPSLLQALLDEDIEACTNLKRVFCGGEALPAELARRFSSRVTAKLHNLYGPTETAIDATFWIYRGENDHRSVPIGRPVNNTRVYLLNSNLQPVPVGISGELYIGGDGVARGYLNRPELTAEKFIPNPFSEEPNARLYKTGDLGRYLPDGAIEFQGRIDDQVKVRGFRIELGEIEAVLAQHPAVRESVVVAREHMPGNQQLAAYAALLCGQTLQASEARAFLKEKLPEYMVPSVFVFLDSLPLTPNGKVDRRALPTPDKSRPDLQQTYVPPGNPVETKLAEIWARLLGLERVGTHDNFFDVGGHSLLGAQMFARLEKEFGRHLPLATLFRAPTIAELALLLGQPEAPTASLLIPYQTEGSRPPFFSIHFGEKWMLPFYPADLDQPWYGLYMSSIDGRRDPDSMEEMAADYIRHIQTVQPQGPYYLGGYCFGGVLAFEIARQLQRRGETVDLLVLVSPSSPRPEPAWRPRGLRGIFSHYRARIIEQFKTGIGEQYLARGRRIPHFCRKGYREVIQRRARRGYAPKLFSGRINLLSTSEKPSEIGESWRQLAGDGLEIFRIPGNHDSLFKPQNAPGVFQQLAACLRRAQQREAKASHRRP